MRAVDLLGLHLEPGTGSPIVLLQEHDEPHRVLPIFIGNPEATAIALAVSDEEPPRPLTHDLAAALVRILDGDLEAVEVTDLRDGTFYARLRIHGPGGHHDVDSRPSDAIALALRLHAPLFVSEAVLDEAGAMLTEPVDEETVEEFRSFLDEIDPADFGEAGETGAGDESGEATTDDDANEDDRPPE